MGRKLKLIHPERETATPTACVVRGCRNPVPAGLVCVHHARLLADGGRTPGDAA